MVVFAVVVVVVVDSTGFESEAEPATEFELVLVAPAVGRSGFESAFEVHVDRQLLRLGRGVAAAIICIAVETLPADPAVYMSLDTTQQPPRSPVLLPKPVQQSKYFHSQQCATILWPSLKIYRGADKSLARPGRRQAIFRAFYGTWRFITTSTTAHPLSLP